MPTLFGSGIKRREDPRLITGRATYTDDVKLPGLLYASILRSTSAHARLKKVDVAKAKKARGVVAIYTGADIKDRVATVPCAWNVPNCDLKVPPHPLLAVDKVRYVGDGIALVVAESRAGARDALDLIEVDYGQLDAVVDPEQAAEEGAPQLHDDVPGNIAFTWKVTGGDAAKAFADAQVTIEQRILQPRLQPTAMEPRSACASYNTGSGQLTAWITSQNPHIHRLLLSVMLKLPEHRIRVIAPEVGGGFGSKIPGYADEALVCFATMDLGRPVKWTEDRSENYKATIHGRDHVEYVELCGTKDGKVLGLRTKVYAGLGAYASTAAPGVPTILHGLMYSGPYTIPNISGTVYGVYTTTTPVDAYRGAGRPEATFLLERMMNLYAQKIGLDPVEVRRKNLIPKEKFPYTTATGIAYDSGDYQGALDKLLEHFDVDAFRSEQASLRDQGVLRGVGFSTYVEVCGLAPSRAVGPQGVGLQAAFWESANVRVTPTGSAIVYTGTSPHGQGLDTSFAQIAGDVLGIDPQNVDILHGDTDQGTWGWDTYGSRSLAVGGEAIVRAARKVQDKAKRICAALLEAAPEDIELTDGKYQVRGSPDKSMTMAEIAGAAHIPPNELPADIEPGLEESSFYDPENFVFPFGAHACVVEVDAETGKVTVVRYVAVDDCGPAINPMLIDGQIHGGIVHAIGQALYEQVVYDEDGQLVTGTFVDYALPTAAEVPSFETDRTETPSPVNSLGVKGIGEAGTIGATPAVAAAVLDAIRPLGVTELDMPMTPMRVWQAIHGNGPRATEQGRSLDEQGKGSAGSGPAAPPEGGAA
jgi:aerobic carbon-monoxide dehydrogenase large subunit